MFGMRKVPLAEDGRKRAKEIDGEQEHAAQRVEAD